MKTLIEKAVGGDGATVGFYVEGGNLAFKTAYPIAKALEPIEAALDGMIDKLKAAIPGSWDDVLLERVKTEYKNELVKRLAE